MPKSNLIVFGTAHGIDSLSSAEAPGGWGRWIGEKRRCAKKRGLCGGERDRLLALLFFSRFVFGAKVWNAGQDETSMRRDWDVTGCGAHENP